MKKQKVEVEEYSLEYKDITTILGLNGNQRITDISTSHTGVSNWGLTITVKTTHTTELVTPTHKN